MNERAMREYTRWAERVTDPELAEQLAAMKGDEKAIEDAFFQDLEFGTAGLRGVLGAGSNRMNVYTVALATQGLANYLKANFDERRSAGGQRRCGPPLPAPGAHACLLLRYA